MKQKKIPLQIGSRLISDSEKPFLIAELGQAHNGSIEKVFNYIDNLSKINIDAIKFQLHLADEESTLDEPFRVKIKNFKSRYDYWKKMQFSNEQWFKISEYCKKRKKIFLCSTFSLKGLEILKKLKIKALKIPSGEFRSKQLINEMIKTKLPIILSTGMMSENEIDYMHNLFKKNNVKHSILHCRSNYPVKLEDAGLNLINKFLHKYNCQIGYSDHTGKISSSLFSIVKGCNILEVHVKLKDSDQGPDASSSINLKELSLLSNLRDEFFILKQNMFSKKRLPKDLIQMRSLFSKSLSLKYNINKNVVIKNEMITEKKPGTGIQLKDKNKIIGKMSKKNLYSNRLIKFSDLK